MSVEYPNKIYVLEYTGDEFLGKAFRVVVVAASSVEVAKDYVKKRVGIDSEPTWLMNGAYPTIWTSDGEKPHPIQAKILYNTSCFYNE